MIHLLSIANRHLYPFSFNKKNKGKQFDQATAVVRECHRSLLFLLTDNNVCDDKAIVFKVNFRVRKFALSFVPTPSYTCFDFCFPTIESTPLEVWTMINLLPKRSVAYALEKEKHRILSINL